MQLKKSTTILTLIVASTISLLSSAAHAVSQEWENGMHLGFGRGQLVACQIATNKKIPEKLKTEIMADGFSSDRLSPENQGKLIDYLVQEQGKTEISDFVKNVSIEILKTGTKEQIRGYDKGFIFGLEDTLKKYRPDYKFDNSEVEMHIYDQMYHGFSCNVEWVAAIKIRVQSKAKYHKNSSDVKKESDKEPASASVPTMPNAFGSGYTSPAW